MEAFRRGRYTLYSKEAHVCNAHHCIRTTEKEIRAAWDHLTFAMGQFLTSSQATQRKKDQRTTEN